MTGTRGSPEQLAAVSEVADLVVAGDEHVDLGAALAALRQRGVATVLCEGGPTLNGELVAHDLLDELCLTLSPAVVGGDAGRITHGPVAALAQLELARVLEQDGTLLLRYLRRR